MKKIITLSTLLLFTIISFGQTWTTITTDASGDSGGLDGILLEYWHDDVADSLWFRITTAGINTNQSADFGVNIMVNYPGGGSTFNFWGADNQNAFHRLLTIWVTGGPPSNYAGTIGISDATGVNAYNYTSLSSNNIDINLNMAGSTIIVGMNRSDLVPNAALGQVVATAAAVGTSSFWEDDIYSPNGTMILSLTTTINHHQDVQDLNVYPNPAWSNLYFKETIDFNELVIFDAIGNEIIRNSSINNESIDVSELENGIYFISIYNEDKKQIAVSKFIKQ